MRAAEDGASSNVEGAWQRVSCVEDSGKFFFGLVAQLAGGEEGSVILGAHVVEDQILVERAEDLTRSFDLAGIVTVMNWVERRSGSVSTDTVVAYTNLQKSLAYTEKVDFPLLLISMIPRHMMRSLCPSNLFAIHLLHILLVQAPKHPRTRVDAPV
jgi:hypothetical protein